MSEVAPDIQHRVIIVPALAKARRPPGFRANVEPLTFIAALIGLAILSWVSANQIVHYASTYSTVFPINATTLAANDRERFELSGWPNAKMLGKIDEVVPPQDIVLAGRQAEMSFYSQRHFVSHLSPEIADVFASRTPDEARRELLKRGVRWILRPAYGLVEFNETAVGALIADPNLAQPAFDVSGWILYRLYETPRTEAGHRIAGADFTRDKSVRDPLIVNPMTDFGARLATFAKVWIEKDEGGIVVQTIRPAPLDRSFVTVVKSGDPPPDWTPSTATTVDIPSTRGRVAFKAGMAGTGVIDVLLVTWQLDSGAVEQQILWSGTLLREPRVIAAQFIDADESLSESSMERRLSRVEFRLRGPGRMAVSWWTADAFPLFPLAGADIPTASPGEEHSD